MIYRGIEFTIGVSRVNSGKIMSYYAQNKAQQDPHFYFEEEFKDALIKRVRDRIDFWHSYHSGKESKNVSV